MADNSAGAKAIGWDPQKGWGPGLGVNSLPGAPGQNDARIFAAQERSAARLNPQQFNVGPEPQAYWDSVEGGAEGYEGPEDDSWMPEGWGGKPPTAEEQGY